MPNPTFAPIKAASALAALTLAAGGLMAQAAAVAPQPIAVSGVALGMPAKDVAGALRKTNAKYTVKQTTFAMDLSGDYSVPTNPVILISAQTPIVGESVDRVSVMFSLPPTASKVTGVLRSFGFNPDQRPTVANVVTAMRTAYGPPADSVDVGNVTLFWAFDTLGKPLPASATRLGGPMSQAADYCLAFLSPQAGIREEHAATASINVLRGEVGRPEFITGPMDNMRRICTRIGTTVKVEVIAATFQGPIARAIEVQAFAVRDQIAAIDASRAFVKRQAVIADSIAKAKAAKNVIKP
jgi:hypothetical protein